MKVFSAPAFLSKSVLNHALSYFFAPAAKRKEALELIVRTWTNDALSLDLILDGDDLVVEIVNQYVIMLFPNIEKLVSNKIGTTVFARLIAIGQFDVSKLILAGKVSDVALH